jgi:type I restriction enzyme, R subunit
MPLLVRSCTTLKIEGVAITAPIIEGDEVGGRVDLSDIDFDKLAKLFASRPRTSAEKLRSEVEAKAHDMAASNPTRVNLVEKLEKLVETYNLGTLGVEAFFEALKALVAEMEEEERRAAREGLTGGIGHLRPAYKAPAEAYQDARGGGEEGGA